VTDDDICAVSQVANLAVKGTAWQADRGFKNIRFELAERGTELLTPAFCRSEGGAAPRLTREEGEVSAAIANSRIKVENFLALLAPWRWLKNGIPILSVDLISQAFRVCAVLAMLNTKQTQRT
jgi:hypothetical protein